MEVGEEGWLDEADVEDGLEVEGAADVIVLDKQDDAKEDWSQRWGPACTMGKVLFCVSAYVNPHTVE